jgi:hypothetical protein
MDPHISQLSLAQSKRNLSRSIIWYNKLNDIPMRMARTAMKAAHTTQRNLSIREDFSLSGMTNTGKDLTVHRLVLRVQTPPRAGLARTV